jgi:hypothetical protein
MVVPDLLKVADTAIVGAAAKLWAEPPGPMSPMVGHSRIRMLLSALSSLGMTPADRQRMGIVPAVPHVPSPWDELQAPLRPVAQLPAFRAGQDAD